MRAIIFCGIFMMAALLAGCQGKEKAEEGNLALSSEKQGAPVETAGPESIHGKGEDIKGKDAVNIRDLLESPDEYLDKEVVVSGQFQGWSGVDASPPLTRSDWVIKDDTGAIYVSGPFPPGCNPPNRGMGMPVTVKGILKASPKGTLYIKIQK
jgi:hypothetical protein